MSGRCGEAGAKDQADVTGLGCAEQRQCGPGWRVLRGVRSGSGGLEDLGREASEPNDVTGKQDLLPIPMGSWTHGRHRLAGGGVCMHLVLPSQPHTLPRRSHLCICQAEGGRHSLLPSPPHLLGSLPPLLLLSRAFYHMATVTTWPRASLLSQNTARTQMGNLLICTY